jgi:thiamine biosynthesis lipoprotein
MSADRRPRREDGDVAVTRREEHQRYADARGFASAEWRALGTTAHLVVTDAPALGVARRAVEEVLADIDDAASRFRPDSELSRLNTAAGAWVPVGPTLALALRVAADAAEWTGGLVDPTVGNLLVDYGYDRTFAEIAADGPAATVAVRRTADWTSIDIDENRMRARVPAGVLVDLGATAKGLAADLAAAAAADATGCGVLVSLGGDISVGGAAPDEGWPVTVADVSDLSLPYADETAQIVVITTGGLATSSVNARRWRRGGSDLHHIIDPRSAAPAAAAWRTVSVTAATCALANAASTAAVVLGESAAPWLSARGMHARLVAQDGWVSYVGSWPRPVSTP